jgi:hypothetical protein
LKHGGAGGEHEESVQLVLVARGSSEESLTIVKGGPNLTTVTSLQPLVSITVTMQNEFLS